MPLPKNPEHLEALFSFSYGCLFYLALSCHSTDVPQCLHLYNQIEIQLVIDVTLETKHNLASKVQHHNSSKLEQSTWS